MPCSFETWDVFTSTPLQGNPLAVVFDANELTQSQMQQIAREFNLSETTFVQTPTKSSADARVRVFVPVSEIPFAGHPVIGTAIAIARHKLQAGEIVGDQTSLTVETHAGLFALKIRFDGEVTYAEFESPVLPTKVGDAPVIDKIAAALGLAPEDIAGGAHKPRWFGASGVDYLYVKCVGDALQRISLDVGAFEEMGLGDDGGVYAYADDAHSSAIGNAGLSRAFRARMFAPPCGILEDPATGSAALSFSRQLLSAGELGDGEHQIQIKQGYEMGRPSKITLRCAVQGETLTNIFIGGSAVPVQRGQLASKLFDQ